MAATTGNYRLGPDNGRVVLKTGRQGIAARAGHDLTIEVTRWSAQVEVPDDAAGGVTAATVQAEFDLGSLQVRDGTGGAKPLSDRDRGEIKKQMSAILGTGTASYTSSKIVRFGASGGAVEGTFTLNGQSEPVRVQVSEPGSGRYRGSATVVQTGLGIKPYVGFFGALKLKDEVGVEFEVSIPAADPRVKFLVIWKIELSLLSSHVAAAVTRMPAYAQPLERSGQVAARYHIVGAHGGAWVYDVGSNEELERLIALMPVYNFAHYTVYPLAEMPEWDETVTAPPET